MASAGGLTRRRGAGGALPADNDTPTSRVASPTPRGAPETAYEASENGHKIAYDPRDISENEERNKLPKLTLMEEVLLLGLKDKQVRSLLYMHIRGISNQRNDGLTDSVNRDTCHFGMTIYRMRSAAV